MANSRKEIHIVLNKNFKYGGMFSVEVKKYEADEDGIERVVSLSVKNGFMTDNEALVYAKSIQKDELIPISNDAS